jgi:hypothetical protein
VLAGAEGVTDEEIDAAVDELERQRAGAGGPGAATTKARRIAEDLRLAAQIEKRNAKMNRVIYRQLHDDINQFGNAAQGLEAMIAGSNKRIEGARFSVDALRRAREGKYLGGLEAELSKAELLQHIQPRLLGVGKGAFDDNIARELYELRKDGTPGKTGSVESAAIAKILHKYQELARLDQNRFGAFIRKMDGYIVSQSHDMFRILKAGREAWKARAKGLLDDRTYDNIGLTGNAVLDAPKIDKFLDRVYAELSTGIFHKVDTEAPLIGFKGPANLAKKVSQSRVLHFKDADAWIAYNDEFGTGSLFEAAASGLRHAALTTSLLERFGPNPRAMFDRVLSDLRESSRDAPAHVRERLQSRWAENLFAVADGTVDIPSNVNAAHIAGGVRTVQSMASLGGATLSSIGDVATAASELSYQGHNFAGALGGHLESMLAQVSDGGQRRHAAALVGVGFESVIRDIASRITTADSGGRTLNKLTTLFFKLNLLQPFTSSGERAASEMMSHNLAVSKDLTFGQLPAPLRNVLGLYKIGAREWDAVRTHAVIDINGTAYVDPAYLRNMDGDTRIIDQMETRVRAYFADRSHIAVLQPGIREKAYTTQGAAAGTALGEATRFVMQFKQYGISFVQKVIGRYSQEDRFWSIPGSLFKMPAADAAQFAQLIVTLTGLGYLAMAAKDLAKGRTPRDPTKPATIIAAMVQGGGGGIYGDFLLARTNRFGGGLLETAAGPTASDISDIGDVWYKARDYATGVSSDPPDVETWNLFKNNTPFLNLFYTRAALDYLILYHIQEALNPGSLRRMEQKLKKENGQEFLLPPSEVVN